MSNVKKLVIDRSKWLRGKPGDGVLLRPEDGRMCCLGFLGRACGLTEGEINSQGCPQDTESALWPAWLVAIGELEEDDNEEEGREFADTATALHLMTINDSDKVSDDARERAIAEELAQHGVEVEFVDGEPS